MPWNNTTKLKVDVSLKTKFFQLRFTSRMVQMIQNLNNCKIAFKNIPILYG